MHNGVPWLGMKVADLNSLDRILVIGANLRKEQPLLAQRIRQAAKHHGAQLSVINPLGDDFLVAVQNGMIVPPSQICRTRRRGQRPRIRKSVEVKRLRMRSSGGIDRVS